MTTKTVTLSISRDIDGESLSRVSFFLDSLVANVAKTALIELREQALSESYPPPYIRHVRVQVSMEIEPR
jgi:hypothetical protein